MPDPLVRRPRDGARGRVLASALALTFALATAQAPALGGWPRAQDPAPALAPPCGESLVPPLEEGPVDRPPQTFWKKVLHWPVNRVLDFLDIGRANASIGPGFGFNVHPTRAAQVGLGSFAGFRVGWMGRKLPAIFQIRAEGGMSVLYLETGRFRNWTYTGLMFHFTMLGFEIGIEPVEVADFFTGLVLIDLARDDL